MKEKSFGTEGRRVIYDLDTIDTMRLDRQRKTVEVRVFDTTTEGLEHPHDHYFRHKLEYCVSYILRGGGAFFH